jgi:hypothetical protein
MERVIVDLLATDPGAWNIIGWMLVLVVCGSVVLWAVSTLLLRGGRAADEHRASGAAPPD